MTNALDRIRAVALVLPECEERQSEDRTTFLVANTPFAHVQDGHGATVSLRVGDDAEAWTTIPIADDSDWTLIEDRIARAWELSAPAALLEAGGR